MRLSAAANPFRATRLQVLDLRPSQALEYVFEWLRSGGSRGTIVGPAGSGKSRLLRTLARELGSSGFRVTLRNFDNPRILAALGGRSDSIVMIDGAERLPLPVWLLLLFARSRVIFTAHRAFPWIPVIARCQTSQELLLALLDDLDVRDERLRRRAGEVFNERRGNLREVFRDLYDDARDLPEVRTCLAADCASQLPLRA